MKPAARQTWYILSLAILLVAGLMLAWTLRHRHETAWIWVTLRAWPYMFLPIN